jgi:hypothetical protein
MNLGKVIQGVVLVGGLVAAAAQLGVMVRWAARGQSDFAMLHRTAQAMAVEPPGDFYSRRDAASKFVRSIGPAGMLPVCALAPAPAQQAALVWAALNVLALAAAAACMWGIARRIERDSESYIRTLPAAVGMMLVLACGSLQTGQFSVMFMACWLGALWLGVRRRDWSAGALWALPAVVKFYPGALVISGLLAGRWRQAVSLAVVLAALLVGGPWLMWGDGAWALWGSYVRDALLGSASNAVTHRVNAFVPANQSLDVVLLRYMCGAGDFAGPHAELSPRAATWTAVAVRAAVLVVTLLASVRLARTRRDAPARTLVMLTALWVAAMVLVLPEIKARYAAYALPALWPLVAQSHRAWQAGRRSRCAMWALLAGACTIGLGALPGPLRPWGLGLACAAALWVANVLGLAIPGLGRSGHRDLGKTVHV